MISENKKTKGVGVMAGGYMPDGELLPDRYYARLQHGHLGIYATLEEAVEARRMAEKQDAVNGKR
jgi:hypothetical protein